MEPGTRIALEIFVTANYLGVDVARMRGRFQPGITPRELRLYRLSDHTLARQLNLGSWDRSYNDRFDDTGATAVAGHPLRDIVAMATNVDPENARITLYDLSDGRKIATVHFPRYKPPKEWPNYVDIDFLRFSEDGRYLVAANSEPRIRVWELVPAEITISATPSRAIENQRQRVSPLHVATARSDLSAVTVLLDAGAEVNARAEMNVWGKWIGGETPLHVAAAESTTPAIVTALIDAGADVSARSEGGQTPLHVAAAKSANPAVVTVLIEAGADIHAQNEDRWTPLHLAAAWSTTPGVVTALLGAGANVHVEEFAGSTPLELAVSHNLSAAVVRALAKAGADVHVPPSLLHWAAMFNPNPEVVSVLVEAGVNVHTRDNSGNTPLHWAARYNRNPVVVTALVAAGANVHTRDNSGLTPLHEALAFGKSPGLGVVTALLEAGAGVRSRDHAGRTPLHLAVRYGRTPAVVAALLEAGAAPAAKDQNGQIPWDLIREGSPLEGTDVYWRLFDGRSP